MSYNSRGKQCFTPWVVQNGVGFPAQDSPQVRRAYSFIIWAVQGCLCPVDRHQLGLLIRVTIALNRH